MIRFNSILFIFLLLTNCSVEENDAQPPSEIVKKYKIIFNASDGGSVSSSGGEYSEGVSISVTASPSQGYIFTGWSNGSVENPLSIQVNSNFEISANFEKLTISKIEINKEINQVLMGDELAINTILFDQNNNTVENISPNFSLSNDLAIIDGNNFIA